jgi:hypothetical protein
MPDYQNYRMTKLNDNWIKIMRWNGTNWERNWIIPFQIIHGKTYKEITEYLTGPFDSNFSELMNRANVLTDKYKTKGVTFGYHGNYVDHSYDDTCWYFFVNGKQIGGYYRWQFDRWLEKWDTTVRWIENEVSNVR